MSEMEKNKKVAEATEALGIDENLSEDEEFDLISGFLKAADSLAEMTKNIVIRRQGKTLLKFRIRPISELDMKSAKKKATTYMPNPNNKKLPAIVKDRDEVVYNSYIIYLATVPEDRAQLWDSRDLRAKLGVDEGYELVDKVLLPGEKDAIIEQIDELCGYGDSVTNDIDTAKNS